MPKQVCWLYASFSTDWDRPRCNPGPRSTKPKENGLHGKVGDSSGKLNADPSANPNDFNLCSRDSDIPERRTPLAAESKEDPS